MSQYVPVAVIIIIMWEQWNLPLRYSQSTDCNTEKGCQIFGNVSQVAEIGYSS
jgi:hypothetical protein